MHESVFRDPRGPIHDDALPPLTRLLDARRVGFRVSSDPDLDPLGQEVFAQNSQLKTAVPSG
jgi:hypothetical protein